MPSDQARRGQAGSLGERLAFAGLDGELRDLLRRCRPQLDRHLKTGLRDLFHRFQSFPEAARNFESEQQIERLHDLQASHWGVLTDARFDALYAERVKVLSDAESRMGLDPRWHVAGHAVMLEHLIAGAIVDLAPKSLLPGGRKREQELLDLVGAITRLVMVDVEIAVSLRFNEQRQKHQRALAEQREADHAQAIETFTDVIAALADRDLTASLPADVPDVYREPPIFSTRRSPACAPRSRQPMDTAGRLARSLNRLPKVPARSPPLPKNSRPASGRRHACCSTSPPGSREVPPRLPLPKKPPPRPAVRSRQAARSSAGRSTPWRISNLRPKRSARSSALSTISRFRRICWR
ncbi:protoglobin domain-containing protein [Neorhizobium galegae]|nr:protoglobin domain-containing protein [Neorhizobium galegae]